MDANGSKNFDFHLNQDMKIETYKQQLRIIPSEELRNIVVRPYH